MSEHLGPYSLVRKIAQGGMAEVFLAMRHGDVGGFSKQVAIKRIFPHLAQNPDLITMFFDEAKIAAQLTHPNIVQIFDLGNIDDFYFIAMEYVHGRDLRSVCERGLEVDNFIERHMAVRLIADAASGLHHAHTRLDEQGVPMQIVHRDVSPQNILVSMAGCPKVCDFGIAKASARLGSTRMGQFKGKFAYMSPEQVDEELPIDCRSDIFSLGIVLYEISVCTRLFRGKNDYETVRMVIDSAIEPPSAVRADFPIGLEQIILRALERDPDKRYQTAEDLQLALEEWLIEERSSISQVHIARYMKNLFPELLESPQGGAVDETLEHDMASIFAAHADPLSSQEEQEEYAQESTRLDGVSSSFSGLLHKNEHVEADVHTDKSVEGGPTKVLDSGEIQAIKRASYPQHLMSTPMPQIGKETQDDLSDVGSSKAMPSLVLPKSLGESKGLSLGPILTLPKLKKKSPASLKDTDFGTAELSEPHTPSPELANTPEALTHPPVSSEVARLEASDEDALVRSPVLDDVDLKDTSPGTQLSEVEVEDAQILQKMSVEQEAASLGDATPFAPPPNIHAHSSSVGVHTKKSADIHHDTAPSFVRHDEAVEHDGDFESEVADLHRQSARQKLMYGVILVVCVGVVAIFASLATDKELSKEKLAIKPKVDPELLKEPPIEPLARVDVQLVSKPSDAAMIVNGVLLMDTRTPATASLVAGRTNDVVVIKQGFLPTRVQVKGFASQEVAPIKLEKLPKRAPAQLSSLLVKSEPAGGIVFHNGVQMGPAPVTIPALHHDVEHHIRVQREGSYPFEATLGLVEASENILVATLDARDRAARTSSVDIIFEVVPRQASVTLDAKKVIALGASTQSFKRHQLLHLGLAAKDYEPEQYYLETRAFGTYKFKPFLRAIPKMSTKVSVKLTPKDATLYIGSNSYRANELRMIKKTSGTHAIVLELPTGERISGSLVIPAKARNVFSISSVEGKLLVASP